MKGVTLLCFVLFVLGIVVFLAQLWSNFLSSEMFVKVLVTDGALLFVAFVLNFLIKENKQTDKINKGEKLD